MPKIGIAEKAFAKDQNHTESQSVRFETMYSLKLETVRARPYKELVSDLWKQPDIKRAWEYFDDWYKRVIHSKHAPMKNRARSHKARIPNIVTFCTLGITNGVAVDPFGHRIGDPMSAVGHNIGDPLFQTSR